MTTVIKVIGFAIVAYITLNVLVYGILSLLLM